MTQYAADQSAFLHKELVNIFCGDLLGKGIGRCVYAHALDDTLVIKMEGAHQSFQNIAEWQTWQAVKETEHAKWFAPCVAISPCGGVLVQRRTTPAHTHPESIPNYLTDTKCANYGILIPRDGEAGGQFVCHDYGVHLMLENGMTKRMRKANWWNL